MTVVIFLSFSCCTHFYINFVCLYMQRWMYIRVCMCVCSRASVSFCLSFLFSVSIDAAIAEEKGERKFDDDDHHHLSSMASLYVCSRKRVGASQRAKEREREAKKRKLKNQYTQQEHEREKEKKTAHYQFSYFLLFSSIL